MKKILIICLFCLFSVGCVEKKGIVQFAQLTEDHKILTLETTDAIKKSINDSLNDDNLPESEKRGLEDLYERLDYMARQSVVIHEYVHAKYINEELLAKLLKEKFNK